MKTIFYKLLPCLLILSLTGCTKRNYFPDEDDPGLNLLSSHGFNIGTFYINDTAYINTYRKGLFAGGIINYVPTFTKIATNSTSDTLIMSWPIELNNGSDTTYNSPYQMISLSMPVPKSFTKADLIAMEGKRFASNTNAITLQTSYYSGDTLSGISNIYFVNIKYETISSSTSSTTYLDLSGLFNGNIGDSILITKGRFDFQIDESSLNF